jgi:hypothetical protein
MCPQTLIIFEERDAFVGCLVQAYISMKNSWFGGNNKRDIKIPSCEEQHETAHTCEASHVHVLILMLMRNRVRFPFGQYYCTLFNL